jgi:hypothetical protein
MNHPITIWVGVIITLTVSSYLIKDNIFYRLVQKLALGTSTGILVVLTWQQTLKPYWWTPIRGAFMSSLAIVGSALAPITASTPLDALGIAPLPLTSIEIDYGGSKYPVDLSSVTDIGGVLTAVNNSGANVAANINANGNGIDIVAPRPQANAPALLAINELAGGSTAARLGILRSVQGVPRTGALWLLVLIPGLLWYCQMSKKWFWLSAPIIGLFVGVAAGMAFKSQVNLMIPQLGAALRPLNPWAGSAGFTRATAIASLNNLVFMVALFTTLFYFCFTIKATNRIFRVPMKTGRFAIMVALGAMFGNTVMTRMSFLIERMQFLADFLLKPLFRQIGL